MGNDQAPEAQPPSVQPTASQRPSQRRKKRRILVAVVVVVAALAIIFWGWSSTGVGYVDVGVLYDEAQATGDVPEEYLNETIELRGVVEDWNGSALDLEFKLVDDDDTSKSVHVTLNGTFPAEFANSKSIAATGELQQSMPLRLVASELTVGCSSKY